MAKPRRQRAKTPTPFDTSNSRNSGWHGVPGARHMPKAGDGLAFAFMGIVLDFEEYGIDLDDTTMAIALKIAQGQAERARKRAMEVVRAEEAAEVAAQKPLEYPDAADGYVYFIRRGNYVKIGTTTRLAARMRDLMPDEVLAVQPGSYGLEATLHSHFRHIRLGASCEYFQLTPELEDHIRTVVDRYGPPPAGLAQFNSLIPKQRPA